MNKNKRKQSIDVLAKVWDATANMERYIQYEFSKAEREKLFGIKDGGRFFPQSFDDVRQSIIANSENQTDGSVSLLEILDNPLSEGRSRAAELTPEHFSSVINFSNFLLHVLRVFTKEDVALDDKRLPEQFDQCYLKRSVGSVGKASNNRIGKSFCICIA